MYSLWLAQDVLFLKGIFILYNGDVVFDKSMISRLFSSSSDRIVCDRGKYNKEFLKVSIDMKGYINDISKSIPTNIALGNSIDVYYFSEDSSRILFFDLPRL